VTIDNVGDVFVSGHGVQHLVLGKTLNKLRPTFFIHLFKTFFIIRATFLTFLNFCLQRFLHL